jgi:hypothetical protein
MKPIILFRADRDTEHELEAAQRYFPVVEIRSAVPANRLVIGRYSVLPFYKELEEDIECCASKLINTHRQHRYIADMGNWYRDLMLYTPKTWTRLEAVPAESYPIIIKGETNSKKFLWDTHMFATDQRSAVDVVSNLANDGIIGDQSLYFRQYVPLKKYLNGFRGMPVTKEFRCFVLDGRVLTKAFYWSNYLDDVEQMTGELPNPDDIPEQFLQTIINQVGKNARFYVIDVAQTEDGEWIVIELNDGQMSGLSMTDPDELYKKMAEMVSFP